jgi:invasion protein IalB
MHKINIFKIITILILLSTNTYSNDNTKSWEKKCTDSEGKNCFITIKYLVKIPDNDKKQIFASAYIQIGLSKEKKMQLINEEDQTYKLGEENKPVAILFIDLPLNTDLRKSPLIKSDKNSLGKTRYIQCNKVNGCKTMAILNDKIIEIFKKGKSLSITFAVFGSNENIIVQFPLKGFTKAYDKLAKG